MVYFIFTNSTISQSLIIYIHTYILYFIFLSPLLTNQRMPSPRLARHNLDYMQNYHNCPKGFFIVGFRLNNLSIQIPKGKWLPSESKKKITDSVRSFQFWFSIFLRENRKIGSDLNDISIQFQILNSKTEPKILIKYLYIYICLYVCMYH